VSRFFVWMARLVVLLAVAAGVVMLLVDSPMFSRFPLPVGPALVEATPLLLVGIALAAWLAMSRPSIGDLIKQGFIALAFILWGIDLLMPAGIWARFVSAMVIAIYVFDLAWFIEANLRTRLRPPAAPAAKENR
jgi:hypothetical protein